MKHFKKWLILIPVICGVALVIVLKNNRMEPQRHGDRERVRTVRVLPLSPLSVRPRVTGYGYVAPDRTWNAIAEVGGKVVYTAPNLKKGHFFRKGDLLLKIDTEAYGLAETRGKADVENLEAQLKELAQTRKNTQRVLDVERRSLAISAQELERKQGLFKKGIMSASDLEQEERRFLAQQTVVNNLENSLNLIPARERALLARKTSGVSTVKSRQLDIEKTEFRAPFDGRFSRVHIELGQFAGGGTLLVEAQSTERAEIAVPLTPVQLMSLIPRFEGSAGPLTDMEDLGRALGMSARVSLPLDRGSRVSWQGRFSRTADAVDLKTGTITVYVVVDHPYGRVMPGKRPPLAAGMYVGVTFGGKSVPDQWVVPVTALHSGNGKGDELYLCDTENRLRRIPVETAFRAGELVVISPHPALVDGARLVLSDLMPAVEGMKLNPVRDKETEEWLRIAAQGEDLHGQ